jgi:hypothetical protein
VAAPCSADISRIRADAEALVALGPRPDSTDAAAAAAQRIRVILGGIGLFPRAAAIGEIAVPAIEVYGRSIRAGGARRSTSDNVWVRFAGGTGRPRLMMAHYDTVPGSPGAVDNAGAVAVLLELARCLAETPPPYPMILAFTGGEEIGLLGARALLRDGVAAGAELAVSFDLIGHQRPLAINGVSALWDRWRLEWLADRVASADADADLGLIHRLVSRRVPQLERSDHGPFTAAGIPALHLYGRGAGRIYLAYHSPFDTADRLDDTALANAFDLAAELAYARTRLPAAGDDDLGMWIEVPFAGARVTSELVAIAVEGALAIAALVLLAGMIVRRRRGIRVGAVGLLATTGMFAIAWGAATGALLLERLRTGQALSGFFDLARLEIATTAIAAAVYCLLLIAATRRWRLAMGSRYHAVAALFELAAGGALLAVGAFEIAWLPLTCAALFALAGFSIRRPIAAGVLTGVGAVIAVVPISPGLLREAVFHGFYPTAVPMTAVVAAVVFAPWLAITGALRAALTPPRDRRVLWVIGASLLVLLVAGLGLLLVPGAPCSDEATLLYGYSCRLAP